MACSGKLSGTRMELLVNNQKQAGAEAEVGQAQLKSGLELCLTLINAGVGGNYPPPPENRIFSTREHPLDPRPVCELEFVLSGPVGKKPECSIHLSLVVAAR